MSADEKTPRARATLRLVLGTAIVALLISLICFGVASPRAITIRLDSQGTQIVYGVRLTNPKIRSVVYRGISILKPTEVRLSVPKTAPVGGLVRALDDLKAVGVNPAVKLTTLER